MTATLTDPLEGLSTEDRVLYKLRFSTPYWARHCAQIVNKAGKIVPLVFNDGQLQFDAALEEQRAAGKPMRGLVLKCRQVGFSTSTQGKIIQRTTQEENHHAAVIAHDRDTGGKLYAIGDRIYRMLPEEVKPKLISHRRQKYLHFGEEIGGRIIPDSSYLVDTANEFQAGRGSTYRSIHASEVAFWADIETKLTALLSSVPDDPDTLVVVESTANGANYYKDLWDRAEAGQSDWIAFFWGWWQHPDYEDEFANEAERADFRIGEGPFGEDEPALLALLQIKGFDEDAIKRKLAWRRRVISNLFNGNVRIFKQEFPSTPAEAFISTGRQVFDQHIVQKVAIDVEMKWDPIEPSEKNPGPQLMRLKAGDKQVREGRMGRVEVPKAPMWIPRSKLALGEEADWKIWEEPQEGQQYVIGVDVSGGGSGGTQTEADEPARDAIEIINHETRLQVAEFSSRLDADLLAEQAYLAALAYNMPWLAVEITGSWGLPIARKIWMDFRYPFTFFRKRMGASWDKQEDRLGWDTNRQTKPILEANYAEMLREGTHGIRSRELVLELKTHVRNPKGRSGPESGKHNDRFMAHAIAQQVATLMPVKRASKRFRGGRNPRDDVTGY